VHRKPGYPLVSFACQVRQKDTAPIPCAFPAGAFFLTGAALFRSACGKEYAADLDSELPALIQQFGIQKNRAFFCLHEPMKAQ
jgi:hypothetical protein